MEVFGDLQFHLIIQLLLATLLGGLVGLEREYSKKGAGLRTYALVCLSACFFTVIGMTMVQIFGEKPGMSVDPTRIIQAVAIGIGFLGTGLIIQRQSFVAGLTTAAGLWVVAAIGVAIGVGLYFSAIFAAIISIGILGGLKTIERKIFDRRLKKRKSLEGPSIL